MRQWRLSWQALPFFFKMSQACPEPQLVLQPLQSFQALQVRLFPLNMLTVFTVRGPLSGATLGLFLARLRVCASSRVLFPEVTRQLPALSRRGRRRLLLQVRMPIDIGLPKRGCQGL